MVVGDLKLCLCLYPPSLLLPPLLLFLFLFLLFDLSLFLFLFSPLLFNDHGIDDLWDCSSLILNDNRRTVGLSLDGHQEGGIRTAAVLGNGLENMGIEDVEEVLAIKEKSSCCFY